MRRADRLYRLIESLRGRRCVTAAQLAQGLEVSERTVYRDVRDLMASGVPIEGEAGVGYRLARHYHLPPLMFNSDELAALRLGAAMVGSWGDPALGQLASNALAKIDAVLPRPEPAARARLFVPDLHDYPVAQLSPLRQAIARQQYVQLDYRREDGAASQRRVRPLGLFFWGAVWTLAAWCEIRQDFRNFRIDRIQQCTACAEGFTPEAGRMLEDFFRSVGARAWPSGG